jgi:4-amino-4-deoxy-L-arabinose transferase-like glycosyltransferase
MAMGNGNEDKQASGFATGQWPWQAAVAALLFVHAGLLAWGAWRHSPTADEVGYLASGVYHWHFGQFDLSRGNPPLVRLLGGAPVVLAHPATDWSGCRKSISGSPSRGIGRDFLRANGARSFWLLTLSRWACIPLGLLGGYVSFLWARDLYGNSAGIVALVLWCFSPNLVAHGQLITADVGATGIGLTATYLFWHWLKRPTWSRACACGVGLGLAQLTKIIWIALFGFWPLLWLVWGVSGRRQTRRSLLGQVGQFGAICIVALYVLNLGYAFEGSFQRLGDYRFTSRTLGGPSDADRATIKREGLNRFGGTWMAAIPVPFPREYVQGIDYLKAVAGESSQRAYLRRQWQRGGGWWYYYLYGLAIKVPLGTWMLVLLAVLLRFNTPACSAGWRNELVLLLPIAVLLVFFSYKTTINKHTRNILPALPFAFIWISALANAFRHDRKVLGRLAALALTWSITSSLWIYPHSLSYFSELIGGPKNGHDHLLGSNIEWGQDLLYMKRWLDKHPEVTSLRFAYYLRWDVDPELAGIQYETPRSGWKPRRPGPYDATKVGPLPGWHAVSVNTLMDYNRNYAYYLCFEPVATAGYTILIYDVSLEQCDRVRRQLGMPPLAAESSWADSPPP